MNPDTNPFFRHADVEHFVAYTGDGKAVGRIAATVYGDYNRLHDDRTGFFGFFEAVAEPMVAQALLGAAEGWVRDRGMNRISGPFNYCSTQEMGLLVDGFELQPVVFETHNPSYYPELLESADYASHFTMDTYSVRIKQDLPWCQSVLSRGESARKQLGLTTRRIDRRNMLRDLEIVRRLFNEAFAKSREVVGVTEDVFRFQFKTVRPFVDEQLVTIVERDGRPLAFTLALPDLNQVLAGFNGRIPLWSIPKVPQLIKGIRRAVVLLIGTVPDAQGQGIGAVLAGEILSGALEGRYETLHTTWVDSENEAVKAMLGRADARMRKRYGLYHRQLA